VPEQQAQVKKLETLLVEVYTVRGLRAQEWLQRSLKGLVGMVLKIEEFVD
jgi:hypothetical protein